jgi:hypothetical protein
MSRRIPAPAALPAGRAGAQSGDMTIELRGLEKSFGSVQAVRGVDISIVPGETLALLGPNGAGKSTTIDMLLGLSQPDRGHVSILGRTPSEAIAAGADLTVRELLTMMASLYPQPLDVDEVLELTGIGAIAGRRTQKLSGGETWPREGSSPTAPPPRSGPPCRSAPCGPPCPVPTWPRWSPCPACRAPIVTATACRWSAPTPTPPSVPSSPGSPDRPGLAVGLWPGGRRAHSMSVGEEG